MTEHMQIAETIREQLYAGGRRAVWSWGAHNWVAMPPERGFLGGLRFDVSGLKFTGKVKIMLAYNDTYTVFLEPLIAADFVYCDMLTDVVDELVERD